MQRRASKHDENNKKGGESRYKSINLVKLEKEILKIHQRLRDIRTNHLHQTTTKVVKTKPLFIVIEDLNSSFMMKNRHLSKSVQEQKLREFRRQIEYKCHWYDIRLIIAAKFFLSSKACSQCGSIKRDLNLSDRIDEYGCGLRMDRGLNVSINLRKYGYFLYQQIA